jgi:hypothetical protein
MTTFDHKVRSVQKVPRLSLTKNPGFFLVVPHCLAEVERININNTGESQTAPYLEHLFP